MKTALEPVGLHKPLTVQFHHIYTGKFPKPGVFDNSKDMLVTSAIKEFTTVPAQPRTSQPAFPATPGGSRSPKPTPRNRRMVMARSAAVADVCLSPSPRFGR